MSSLRTLALSCSSLLRLLPLALSIAAVGCCSPWQSSPAAAAPILVARPGCSLWQGRISGNDPSVEADLELCPTGGDTAAIRGRIQFASASSGMSIREVEGSVGPDGVVLLRDVRFEASDPELGWRFCLIDQYELRPIGPERLSGRYDSSACDDHARVELRRSQ